MDRIAEAASMLAAARLARVPLEPLPAPMRPRDEAEAYWVQSAVHGLIARSRFGAIAGYKVDAASVAAQQYLGLKKPCSGGLFSGTMHPTGATLLQDDFRRMGMDCEIAVKLRDELAQGAGSFTASNVAAAVDCYMPAVQIVDDRYVNWRRTDVATLIADDFFGAASVVGKPVPAAEVGDVAGLCGTAYVNGVEIGFGHATDLMGHPMNVLAWLANAMAGRGDRLHAGDTVFLGGLFKTQWLDEGDQVKFDLGRLGVVEFSVA